jgi:PEP-CTERM motif
MKRPFRAVLLFSLFLMLVAGSAWADSLCSINGAPVTCGEDNVTLTNVSGTPAYQLSLTDISSDFSDVYITGLNSQLKNTTGTFEAYVPSANGTYANLDPYMYFTVTPQSLSSFSASDPYALVIVSASGFAPATDAWYQDGMTLDSTVHIVLVNWTAAAAGITDPAWTTCCSNLPMLGDLLNVSLPGGGTWGDLNVYKARVAAGDWGGSGGPYTAYVRDININTESVPEPASVFLLGSGLLTLAGMFRKRSRKS